MKINDFSILTTHKHWDHSGGNKEMAEKIGSALKIYGGAKDSIPGVTNPVDEGQTFQVGNLSVKVFDTPCHTSGHVVYHVTHPEDPENGAVFTGDTMFVGGIGAFFEGNKRA
jgi:hydroxyacylglutathione hydrolase